MRNNYLIESYLTEAHRRVEAGELKPLDLDDDDAVKPGDIVLGGLTPELHALYNLLEEKSDMCHALQAQGSMARANRQPKETIDGLKEEFETAREEHKLLHALFYFEVRAAYDAWRVHGMAIRKGGKMVSYTPKNPLSSLSGLIGGGEDD